jgi:hypothetical protein
MRVKVPLYVTPINEILTVRYGSINQRKIGYGVPVQGRFLPSCHLLGSFPAEIRSRGHHHVFFITASATAPLRIFRPTLSAPLVHSRLSDKTMVISIVTVFCWLCPVDEVDREKNYRRSDFEQLCQAWLGNGYVLKWRWKSQNKLAEPQECLLVVE